MNPIVIQIANGNAFFIGIGMTVFAFVLRLWLVIVEIGGNDLLGNTDSHTFYFELDKLLRKLKSQDDQIVMFELPLLPFWNAFGHDQRILAKKYDVTLIPKRYLVKVFASKGDTLDGLHLSQKGHNELAKSIYDLLKIEN